MFSNLTASYDPIFWPIHVNVDRTWWEWQTQHPTGLPTDLDAVLSPWSYTVRDMLEISRFGYEYVRCSFFMPVGMEAPIARFVSKPIAIDKQGEEIPQGGGAAALGAAACCAPASSAPSSTSRAPTPPRRCATIRTMPAIWRSSATANVTAARATATCRRRGRAPTTSARAATTRRATIAST